MQSLSQSSKRSTTIHEGLPAGVAERGFLARLSFEIIDELINDNIVARYSRRFRLFLQGAPGDVLMIIINGVVKVHCTQPDGRRFLVELAGPGDIIGYVDRMDLRGRHCQAFEAQAARSAAVRLDAQSAQAFVDRLEQAPLAAPAHLVAQFQAPEVAARSASDPLARA